MENWDNTFAAHLLGLEVRRTTALNTGLTPVIEELAKIIEEKEKDKKELETIQHGIRVFSTLLLESIRTRIQILKENEELYTRQDLRTELLELLAEISEIEDLVKTFEEKD